MANWTDQVSKFNPYVSQQPVEEMAKVGMYKQQQYDQGVQKIQGYIDNIAGLDVSRDVDKQHLQSRLDELGSKLKKVAASDFSNNQLVNSVGGMATQIIKDPFIQAAVSSTANDKQQLAEMEADKKKGILTPHAEYYYQLKRAAYLSNNKISDDGGKPIYFSGKYTQSWDIDKNIQEAIKNVGDSKWTSEQVFVTDPITGDYKHNIVQVKDKQTGKMVQVDNGLILSPYAVKEIRAGRFSENVKAAIDGVLARPEARQELVMQGVYNYRGYTDKSQFIQQYQQAKEEGVSLLEKQRINLMSKKMTEKDPEIVKQYEALINKTDNDITNLKSQQDSLIASVDASGSLDAFKGALQTQVKRNSWMRQYVTETTSKTYEKSAPWEVHREQINDERDWWSKQDASKQGWGRISIEQQKANIEQQKWDNDPLNPKSPNFGGGPQTPMDAPIKPFGLLGDNIAQGASLVDNFDKVQSKTVLDYMLALNHANGNSVTKEQMAMQIAEWSKADLNFMKVQYEKAKSDVAKNPKAFPALVGTVYAAQNAESQLNNYNNRQKEMNNSPEVLAATQGKDFKNLGAGIKPFSITYDKPSEGSIFNRIKGLFQASEKVTLNFTAGDILNAAMVKNGGLFKTDAERAVAKQAEQALTDKFGRPAMEVVNILNDAVASKTAHFNGNDPRVSGGGSSWSIKYNENTLDASNINNINNVFSTVVSKVGSAIVAAKEKFLKEREITNLPLAYSLYPKDIKPIQKETIDNNLKLYLNTLKSQGIDVTAFENFYAGTEANKDKYSINVNVDRGTVGAPAENLSLDLYDGKGLVQSLPLTQAVYKSIYNRNLIVPTGVSNVASQVKFNGGKTNTIVDYPTDPDAYKGAFYKKKSFQVKDDRLLGGDIWAAYDGGYNAWIYIKDAKGEPIAVPIYENGHNDTPITFPSTDAAAKYLALITTPAQISQYIDNTKSK